MSLFGDIDASQVPDDPFHIDDGTYLCTLTEINRRDNEEKDTHGISFNWTVTDEDSEFHNSRIQDWKNIYPTLTQEEYDSNEDIRKDLSRLKQRLAQMGVPEEDQNDFLENKDEYVATEAYVTVKNWQNQDDPSKKGRNVTFVRLPEIDD